MRTAEEILKKHLPLALHPYMDNSLEAMKEYAKEALEEAAKKARTRTNDESTEIIVDKQSILSLIDELK